VSFESGQRFGPYTVGETIGAGGMGEVWRATDTHLKRDVAIKVLPASFATDAERLARFQREAEVLASLNHPNIAQIYGLEKSDGKTALVMELVEGETLAQRIMQGPMPVDEVLSIARQIIDALEAAHAKGIIHRDLKPANINLTPDGHVKVLDFGIAKALELPVAGTGAGRAQLTSPAMTEAGLVLGTAAYMSPEQARGRGVDQRTDIWAFGCVLYEMLTGQPAFGGEDRTSTLARVLERSVNLRSLPASTPAPVQKTLALCLEKDPQRRWHHVGDVRLGLDGVFSDGQAEGALRPARHWSIAAAAAVAGALATAIGLQILTRDAPVVTTAGRIVIRAPDDSPLGRESPIAISPDGREIVFVTGLDTPGGMYRRSIDSFEIETIPGGDGAEGVFFAPKGGDIGFFLRDTSQLMRVGLDGGSPTRLAYSVDYLGSSWGSDGTLVFAQAWGRPLSILRPGQPDPADLTSIDIAAREGAHLWPHLLPDSEHVLFTIWRDDPSWGSAEIAIADIGSGEHRVVIEGGVDGRFVESGHIVFWRGDALWAVAFDPASLATTGEPVRVIGDVRMNMGDGSAHFAVSAAGTLAWIPGGEDIFAETMIVDRDGRVVRRLDDQLPTGDPQFSPDGNRVALTLFRGGIFSVGVFDLVRENLESTWTTGDSLQPSWIDNERLSFKSNFEGDYREYALRADGSGSPERLTESATGYTFGNAAWSPDGRTLVMSMLGSDSIGIWRHERGSDGDPVAIIDTAADEQEMALSPAGDLLAYQSDESGQQGIYVRTFPDVDARRFTIDTSGSSSPVWAADGSKLYFAAAAGIYEVAAQREDDGALDFGRPQLALAATGIKDFDVAPDGQTFAVERSPLETASREIRVILNWLDELKRTVPSN
jgi:Tol biopolymer transport system component